MKPFIYPILIFVLLISGCGTGNQPEQTDATDINDSEQIEIDVPVVEKFFQVGVNVAGKTSSNDYTALMEGDDVPIELGPQGSWMIVGAVRTNHFAADISKVKVVAQITAADNTVYGKLTLKKKPLFPSTDGSKYMMNIWLVVSSKIDESSGKMVWEDKDAVFSVFLEDADGNSMEDSVPIHMIKVSDGTR
ncbi:MAG TPA: hypothetical protein EYN66_14615 [Myxococcales bacterium]|nr:hypothetical protein [Myxococcales bacterium]